MGASAPGDQQRRTQRNPISLIPRKSPSFGLPSPPPGFDMPGMPEMDGNATTAQSFAPQLPPPPPSTAAAPSLFDKAHRQDTLLAIGSGLLGGFNFGDGLAAAGQNVMGLNKQLRAEQVKGHEYGGPDNSFDISIDPKTGVRTATPNIAFQNYIRVRDAKPKVVADINGRAMSALQAQPEANRPDIYRHMVANPGQYGIDPRTMPADYDPIYVNTTAQMGQTVAQAQAAQARTDRARDTRDYHAEVQADRLVRTGIYSTRAAATTRQGDSRLAQGQQRIALSAAAGARAAAGKGRAGGKRSPSNDDLAYIQ